ncbi:hypothetical protein BC749_103386 [Flavobacterium araucananum]|uniref:Uncharacterized protein n=1 Tax=Flavobacterium araucananum TaxID=946678 RepID=A0A227P328_9FLAO|nr:hypothetical protein [Flavobacterium araucananum]OXG04299.1 hypothetical protein B0A64_15685 [Flavobacterium araucananum]PWK00002.1 hypothetical protein BC749_103386 [Flavobacterium araucananum]
MNIEVLDSSENFQTWISRDYIAEELKNELQKASVLIVPFEKLRDFDKPLFPIETSNILSYFQQNFDKDFTVDICITDDLYTEFGFYNNYKRLGKFVVATVAIPTFVTILSAYVYDRYIKEEESKPEINIIDNSTKIVVNDIHISTVSQKKYLQTVQVKFSVTVVDSSGNSKEIKFEGPAKEISSALEALKKYEEPKKEVADNEESTSLE